MKRSELIEKAMSLTGLPVFQADKFIDDLIESQVISVEPERPEAPGRKLAEKIICRTASDAFTITTDLDKYWFYFDTLVCPSDRDQVVDLHHMLAPHLDALRESSYAEGVQAGFKHCASIAGGYVMGRGPEGVCARAIQTQINAQLKEEDGIHGRVHAVGRSPR